MTIPYGVDISRYQYSSDGSVKMDFDKLILHANKPKYIGIRAGVSWGYVDAWFSRSFSEAGRVGLYRMPYHVIYFGESAQAQVDNFFRIAGNADWNHDRPVLDLEVAGSNTKSRITATTIQVMEIIKQRIGYYPINYSRKGWIDQYLSVNDMPKCDWWLASYLTSLAYPAFTPEMQPPPYMPIGVNQWVFHQTGSKGDGISHGAASHYIDQNRFNGTDGDLARYFGYSESPLPSLEERVTILETNAVQTEKRLKALEAAMHTHLNMPIIGK